MGALVSMVISTVVGVGVFIGIFVGANLLLNKFPTSWRRRLRPWVFVGPAMLFMFVMLIAPMIRTVWLSLHEGKRGDGDWTLSNYTDILTDDTVISFKNWTNIFTSRLFLLGILLIIVAAAVGARYAKKSYGSGGAVDLSGPGSISAIAAAVVAILFAIFSTLRGVLWNNLWWVVAVTGLATVFGLAMAVLADRSRGETTAKTFIFLPMAISMVGAAIIWSYMYNLPAAGQSPGLLNQVIDWVGVLPAPWSEPIDFVRSAKIIPWNNFFIMLIMIWIQTGFALVVFSAAIKGVPTDLIEAAKVDGATESQVFWKITIPQILPTIIVVVTTLIVTIMKIFDIVKATTNGNFDTDVLANRMYENLRNGNFALSGTFAIIILVLVLPIVWYNTRRGKESAR